MNRLLNIYFLFGVALLFVVSCSKIDESMQDNDSLPITFSTTADQLTIETKSIELVDSGESDFGSYEVSVSDRATVSTRLDGGSFAYGDQIGIYLYYNYWYDQNSESVILDDATLTVGDVENSLDPQKIWTFSSLGGNVPTALSAAAYYPKSANADLEYQTAHLEWTHDSTVDFLVASLTYGDWLYAPPSALDSEKGALFKEYITVTRGGNVALEFKHQMATLSFFIYKAAEVTEDLTIKSLKVNYTCAENYDSGTDSDWSDATVTKESVLRVESGGDLGLSIPNSPLTFENDIFLPPNTVINSISFSFDGTSYSYTWHPHIEDMAIKNYKIQFELDPDRKN